MQIYANNEKNVLRVKLIGELDEHTAAIARREADRLADQNIGCDSVVFDLKEVSFMDSTGIGFLIGRYKKCKRLGMTAYVTAPSQSTDKILAMSGVYTLMPKI